MDSVWGGAGWTVFGVGLDGQCLGWGWMDNICVRENGHNVNFSLYLQPYLTHFPGQISGHSHYILSLQM